MKKRAVFALCLAAVFAGCRTGAGSSDDEKREIQKYKVQFSASPTEGGSVVAKTKDGNVLASGSFVEKGTEIVFTAVPKEEGLLRGLGKGCEELNCNYRSSLYNEASA